MQPFWRVGARIATQHPNMGTPLCTERERERERARRVREGTQSICERVINRSLVRSHAGTPHLTGTGARPISQVSRWPHLTLPRRRCRAAGGHVPHSSSIMPLTSGSRRRPPRGSLPSQTARRRTLCHTQEFVWHEYIQPCCLWRRANPRDGSMLHGMFLRSGRLRSRQRARHQVVMMA